MYLFDMKLFYDDKMNIALGSVLSISVKYKINIIDLYTVAEVLK